MLQHDRALYERFCSIGHWQDNLFGWDAESPDEILSSGELRSCIEEMLEALPELQGATLNLREQQGYSLAKICNILDVSESNVRVLLHRARNRMFRCIEHFLESGEYCTE